MSFAMLTDSEVMPARQAADNTSGPNAAQTAQERDGIKQAPPTPPDPSFAEQIESATQLFEILSSRSDIDHPICTECTEIILSSLKSRLDASTKERDAYISFLKTLKNSAPSASEVTKAQAALKASRTAEAKAFSELQALEQEKTALEEEVTSLEAESLALDEEEQSFWRSRNAFSLELSSFRNQRDALKAAYEHDAQQLEQLTRTNVYNDALYITSDGTFATINGLRLGRLPPKHSVDWAEINAAWGYAALLLATVADKLGFSFQRHRIKPMGSNSQIEREEQQSPQQSTVRSVQSRILQDPRPKVESLDLFSSGDVPLAKAVFHRRINAGMEAFLECLRQLCVFVEEGSKDTQVSRSPRSDIPREGTGTPLGLKLPYRIKKDKIGNEEKGYVSIRLNASSDAEWTDACKYTLTCCKYLLAAMGRILDART